MENAERKIDLIGQDYKTVLGQRVPRREFRLPVTEGKIALFCQGCDYLQTDNICWRVGANNQGRYARRQWCGWSMQRGVSGEMMAEGFNPYLNA